MEKESGKKQSAISIALPVLMVLWVLLILADILNNLSGEKESVQMAPVEEVPDLSPGTEEFYESGLPAEAQWGQEGEESNK